MNREKAMQWVAALRSGQYEQTREYLRAYGGWCCLGVLCDLNRDAVRGKWISDLGQPWKFEHSEGMGNHALSSLPGSLMREVDISDATGIPCIDMGEGEFRELPVIIDDREYNSLADANDKGVSFAKIADWIEANWEKL